MPIVDVQAFSKEAVMHLTGAVALSSSTTRWISFHDPEHSPFVLKQQIFSGRAISVACHDIDHDPRFDDDVESLVKEEFNKNVAIAPFTDEQAERVVKAIFGWHNSPMNIHLVVNCHAGISRSGAVVDFCRIMFNLDPITVQQMNPKILPNSRITRKLFKAAFNKVQ